MTKDLACAIIRVAFRSSGELEQLIGKLKAECSPQDYDYLKTQVAAAIDGIHTALTSEMLKRYPELADEIDANLATSGRAIP